MIDLTGNRELVQWVREQIYKRHGSPDIEPLLLPPYISRRTPRTGNGIPPLMGIGVAIQRLSEPITGIIEHGMLIRLTDNAPVPYNVHLPTALASYLGGAGSPMPGGGPNQYIIGPYNVINGNPIWGTDPTYWQTDPYQSQIWTQVADPSPVAPWTGIGKLYVQAKNAVAESIQVLDFSMDPSISSMTRIWDSENSTYRYYWIEIEESAGVIAAELTPGLAGATALQWMNDWKTGTWNPDIQTVKLLEAHVVSTLQAQGPKFTLMTPAEIAPVWSGPAIIPYHGWAFTQCKLGTGLADLSKASTVTHQNLTDRTQTKVWHIAFGVTAGQLTGSLSEMESGAWSTRYQRLWGPDFVGDRYCLMTGQSTPPASPLGVAPLYSFWGDSSEIVLRAYSEYTLDSYNQETPDYEFTSGPGQITYTHDAYENQRLGKFYTTGVIADPGDSYSLTGGIDYDAEFNSIAIGTFSCGTHPTDCDTELYTPANPDGTWPEAPNPPKGSVEGITVRLTEVRDFRDWTDWYITSAIISRNPEEVYLVSRGTISERLRHQDWDTTVDRNGFEIHGHVTIRNCSVTTELPLFNQVHGSVGSNTGFYCTEPQIGIGSGLGGSPPDNDTDTGFVDTQYADGFRINPHGRLLLDTDFTDFDGFYGTGDIYNCLASPLLGGLASYHEGAGYDYLTETEIESTHGWNLPPTYEYFPLGGV